MLPSVQEREAMIRRYAISIGVDPDIAVRVARKEGLAPDTWQSNVMQPYGRERSFGDFQLHFAPEGSNPGLGNEFNARTGLDPADPANWEKMNMFALDMVKRLGWSPWMGAAKAGITGKMGVGGSPQMVEPSKPMGAAMGSFEPLAIKQRMNAEPGLLDAPSQQDYSISPSQQPATTDWTAIAKMGGEIMKNTMKDEEEPQQQWLTPQVLAPLRRVQLGKGLLG